MSTPTCQIVSEDESPESTELVEVLKCFGLNLEQISRQAVDHEKPLIVVFGVSSRAANEVVMYKSILENQETKTVIVRMNGGDSTIDFTALLRNVRFQSSYETVDIFLTSCNLERWPLNLFCTRRNANALWRIKRFLDNKGEGNWMKIPLSPFFYVAYKDVIRRVSDKSRSKSSPRSSGAPYDV